jgi:Zn-dependent protease with chaperone function
MLLEAIVTFFKNPLHLSVLIIFWALAIISFLHWREHPKAHYLYAHLFFLLVPLLDFAIAVPCQIPFVQGLLTFCSVVITRTVILLVPPALILAVIGGAYVAPVVYRKLYRAKPLHEERFKDLARKAGVPGTRFWMLDTAKPLAFSFGKDVLMSVGMFELLKKKEQDAVFLHELGHVKHQSSAVKFSTWLARFFSPVAHFASLGARIDAEERAADVFAIRMQGTGTYLGAAKRKMYAYCSGRP